MAVAELAASFLDVSLADSKDKKIFMLELNSFEYNVTKVKEGGTIELGLWEFVV